MTRRTTIEIDDALAAEVQAALGTTGLKDTVHRALSEAVRAERRRKLAERLRTGEGFDFSPEVIEQVRRWRT